MLINSFKMERNINNGGPQVPRCGLHFSGTYNTPYFLTWDTINIKMLAFQVDFVVMRKEELIIETESFANV